MHFHTSYNFMIIKFTFQDINLLFNDFKISDKLLLKINFRLEEKCNY